MKKFIILLFIVFNSLVAFAGSCTSATNDMFTSATSITIGAAAITGTTCNATIESGESLGCNKSADQTVWYTFTATATMSYVTATTTGSCYIGSAIYTGSVLPVLCSIQSCQSASNGPLTSIHQLVTIIGQVYKIQITYSSGGPCGNEGTFTIRVTNTCASCVITNPRPLNSCSTADPGCYFTSPPTTADVTSTCTNYSLSGGANLTNYRWYTFTTPSINAITLNFQNIISSTCGGGNVSWWIWKLYDNSCNPIACGDLSSLNYLNTSCNTTYRLEYMWEQLSCTYTSEYPFQYTDGTSGCFPLPVNLISFSVNNNINKNEIKWTVSDEHLSNYYIIERSIDVEDWLEIKKIKSNNVIYKSEYYIDDYTFSNNINYYRLKQTDIDGRFKIYDVVSVDNTYTEIIKPIKVLNNIGQEVDENYKGFVIEYYINGNVKKRVRQ